MYATKLVVRQNTVTGRAIGGHAGNLPRLGKEWRDIASFGRWFGCQMSYRPYKAARQRAMDYADYVNGLAGGAK